ncbi:MAG: hypothetical protein ACTIC2_14530 [Enterococcus devriesei]|uniref:hypothetical protein n=1 Tax=Enterococcus devriesei TaxID=319970 RepID=UPI003F8F50CA
MKTAVSQVYSILNSAEKTKTIDFYTNSVPESAQTVPSLPIGRIVELYGNYDDYASNNPLSIQFNVQVDVWVSTLKEVDAFYFALDEVMRSEGWECTYTEQTDDEDLEGAKRIIKRYVANISLN